ncbi:hypothetical protein DLREEDagrD3_11570 [Denitratisoma sp. agr-D3]
MADPFALLAVAALVAAPFVAAAILAFAAAAKAINARPALAALIELCPFLPPALARAMLLLLVATQGGLALLLVLAPSAFVAACALLLLVGLMSLSLAARWRGVRSDCGCYGRFAWLGPRLVWLLDGVLLLCLSVALLNLDRLPRLTTPSMAWLIAVVCAGACAALTAQSLRLGRLWPRPPFLSGAPWPALANHAGLRPGNAGEQYTVFLSESCAQCGRMLRVLQLAREMNLLPDTRLVMSEGQSLYDNPFPLTLLPPARFNRLVDSVPLLVVNRGDKVEALWPGQLPPALVEQVRQGRAKQKEKTQAAPPG